MWIYWGLNSILNFRSHICHPCCIIFKHCNCSQLWAILAALYIKLQIQTQRWMSYEKFTSFGVLDFLILKPKLTEYSHQ